MRLVVLAMLLAACATRPASPRPAAQPEPARAQPRPPRFCPPGTKLVGQRPPEGIAVHCERPNGLKHGPYVLWFDNGQKEEEGSYWEGEFRGRRRIWDEHGRLLHDEVFGAPLTVCVYDRTSRRAVRLLPVDLVGQKRFTMFTDESGRATTRAPLVGGQTLEWWTGTEQSGPSTREIVVDRDHEQSVTLEIDVSRLPPVVLGSPSPCAPR